MPISPIFSSYIVKLLKKVIKLGDTSCLLPIMDIFKDEDRKLMQTHCRSRALSILKNKREDADIKEAIAYLSFAIIASGKIIKIWIGDSPLWEIRSGGDWFSVSNCTELTEVSQKSGNVKRNQGFGILLSKNVLFLENCK